tara:strand:- start:326 stop:1045 length:720 start_codon:yes stop_codon:yes gene_type:complete
MDCYFVISRFREDLNWIKILKDQKVIIYNKGEKLNNYEYKNIINLKNVGRESHTWLYHIVNNYNNLSDVNIFLQGRIDDLGCMSYKNPMDYLKNINDYGFCASRYGLLGPFHWKYNVGVEFDKRYKEQWNNGKISRSKIGFRKFSENLFPNIPIFVATSYGGCFAVKKENIRKHELSFYQDILEILEKHMNPIEGHYMERLWCYIFTKNQPLLRSINDVIQTKLDNLYIAKKLKILLSK